MTAPTSEWMCQGCGNLNGHGMTAIPWNCMRCGLSHTARSYPAFDPASGQVVHGPFANSGRCPLCGFDVSPIATHTCTANPYRLVAAPDQAEGPQPGDIAELRAMADKFERETQVFLGYRNAERAELLRHTADELARLRAREIL